MEKKTIRAPLALAIVAILAASLVPVSGADSPTTLYTFHTGENAPKWTILKLEVTKPGVKPTIFYETDDFKCPSYWGTKFLTGTPQDARSYYGFGVVTAVGRHGADTYTETPLFTMHQDFLVRDGEESCMWFDFNVEFEELPMGTVYVLNMALGVPFEGAARLVADPTGVRIVGQSSGVRGDMWSETHLGSGQGVIVHGPPFCGAPWEAANCPANHMNPGGHNGVAVEVDQHQTFIFKHHPWFWAFPRGTVQVANASLQHPDGTMQYLTTKLARAGDVEVNPGSIQIGKMGAPPGSYRFTVHESAQVGALSYSGWNIIWADLRFPEEVG